MFLSLLVAEKIISSISMNIGSSIICKSWCEATLFWCIWSFFLGSVKKNFIKRKRIEYINQSSWGMKMLETLQQWSIWKLEIQSIWKFYFTYQRRKSEIQYSLTHLSTKHQTNNQSSKGYSKEMALSLKILLFLSSQIAHTISCNHFIHIRFFLWMGAALHCH